MDLEKVIGTGLTSANALEGIYRSFLEGDQQVDPSWEAIFNSLDRGWPAGASLPPEAGTGDARVQELIQAYRMMGHLLATTNPLAETLPVQPPELTIEHWGFSAAELQLHFPTFGLLKEERATLEKIVAHLQGVYCRSVGAEFIGICTPDVEQWIESQIEPQGFTPPIPLEQKTMILEYLNKSELFESFLHTKYPGQKRFSLEGGEALIPMLAGIIDKGAEGGAEEFIIGMAHRGRLNVLSNILNKSYVDIFSEFNEGYIHDSFEGTGDVKYHKGFFSHTISSHGHKVNITVTPNPSHLEAVGPVVAGQVKAKQIRSYDSNADKIIALLIHGDASLSGQGVVYEALQFGRLPGYSSGGVLHLVVNNQIGFTTLPSEGRSTFYCTDIAKAFGIPVFHVNGEDPEACFFVAQLAVALRHKFGIDVFIDLICYRKYGHNESDEPAYTQPLAYQKIRQKQPLRELYRDRLIAEGLVEKEWAENTEAEFKKSLQEALDSAANAKKKAKEPSSSSKDGEMFLFKHANTGVTPGMLQEIAEKISKIPEGFSLHGKLQNLVKERFLMIGDTANSKPIDWGMAELLAYGSLLNEGKSVRLTGQDSCRGTFSHRHAMWVDQKTSKSYYPLQHISGKQGRFDAYNSPLSEYASLGFEFGYSLTSPEALVLWEAQFGDFSNGAQILIDQFISTAEQKWGQKFSLTLLLPHGYEGQGPEHSSARIERFLTLAGQNNMRIANPTTPGQLFHLLRRQVHDPIKKPLVVFTPKGLLRHPKCVSHVKDLAQGSFQEILDDPQKIEKAETVVCCSGRIFYDLLEARAKREVEDMAIIRIEQIYPFDRSRMQEILLRYKDVKECVWIQEEPINMGPCGYISRELQRLLPEHVFFREIARPRSASPAVGSHALHQQEHAALLAALFGYRPPNIFELAGEKT